MLLEIYWEIRQRTQFVDSQTRRKLKFVGVKLVTIDNCSVGRDSVIQTPQLSTNSRALVQYQPGKLLSADGVGC